MSTNTGPDTFARRGDRREMMAAYDALPAAVRHRLANALFNFDPVTIATYLDQGCPVEEILTGLDRSEAIRVARASGIPKRKAKRAPRKKREGRHDR